MQMAIDVAGFTPAEADELRQAMGSKRSRTRMERLRARLYEGMAERGITGRGGRRDLREDVGLRQLRLPREPQRLVRLPGVRLVLDQAARAGGVLRGPGQRAADGLLLSALPGAGRPPPRRGGAHAGPQRLVRRSGARALPRQPQRRRRAPRAGFHPGSASAARRARSWRTEIAAGRPVRGPGGPGPPGAGPAAAPAGGHGHRRRLRVLRPGAARGAVGGGRGLPVPARPPGRRGDRRPRPHPAGHDTGGGVRGRSVGHRGLARGPPHAVPAPAPDHARRGDGDGPVGRRRRGSGCWWAVSSRTVSVR